MRTIILPMPTPDYREAHEAERNRILEREVGMSLKQGDDIHLTKNGLFLTSPNGQQWRLTVSDTGVLGVEHVTRSG